MGLIERQEKITKDILAVFDSAVTNSKLKNELER